MATTEDVDVRFLDACQRGELKVVQELIERNSVNPNKIVERRNLNFPNHDSWGSAKSCTPLHYASL